MAHYRMLDRTPSAIVTAGGSEKKVYDGNVVYLNKGDNFELRFFNPLQEKIGIEIIFNGQKKSDGFLVLNPGEDVSLDRFLGDKNKMVFDTYMIDSKNPTAAEAAALNGIIDIKFHKEKNTNWYTPNYKFSTRSFSGGFDQTNSNSRIYGSTVSLDSMNENFDDTNTFMCCSSLGETPKIENLTETGRVEKGEVSDQNLNVVELEFDVTAFHTIQYNLKPLSTMRNNISEVRNYCSDCGYRVRNTAWLYCPKCGKKIM